MPRQNSVILLFLLILATVFPQLPHTEAAAPATASNLSVVIGRPTDHSVTLSILTALDAEACAEYGVQQGVFTGKTESQNFKADVPAEFEIKSLKPDSRYYYRLILRPKGTKDFQPGPEGVFQTQRSPGATFSFGVQGDSHPEREGKMFNPELYRLTMRNVAKSAPDFYFMLGDDFSIERLIERDTLSPASVNLVYARQRPFLGEITRSSALFLVNGNHEQAARCNLAGTPNNPAILAGNARVAYYPLPAPGAFYSGDAENVPGIGLLRDYYAWTWGDALFVVIDPYWHSPVPVDNIAGVQGKGADADKGVADKTGVDKAGKGDKAARKAAKHDQGGKMEGAGGGKRDLWAVTLGDAQYQWLKKTLLESKARWKFVFCHHVLGTGRGGIEEAGLYEWGGKDRKGRNLLAEKRPGWPLSIHDLMVKSGVTIFFQGHDHIYAHQELNGVVYQSCPNPADNTYQAFNRDAYLSGDILPNSGFLRVNVSPENVRLEYVRSFLPADEGTDKKNGMIAHSYTIPPKRAGGAQ